MIWSQSLVKAFMCHRKGKLTAEALEKFGKAPSQPGPALVGTAFHLFAKLYLEHCMKSGAQTDVDQLVQLLRRVQAVYPNLGIWSADLGMLAERFVGSTMAPLDRHDIKIEEEIEGRLAESIDLVGTPDLVVIGNEETPDIIRIVDYKTDRRIRSQSECEAEIQLPFYALLVAAWYPEEELPEELAFELVYSFVRYQTDVAVVRTLGEIREFGETLAARIAPLQALTEWEAMPGEACRFCDHARGCPALDRALAHTITDADQAREYAGEMLALTRRAAEIRELLKAWSDLAGGIEVPGGVMDFAPEELVSYPGLELRRVLVGDPANPLFCEEGALWGALAASKTAAGKIINQFVPKEDRKAVYEDLEAGAKRSKRTKFKLVKKQAGGGDE
jgi:hypothetical protein